MQPRMFLRRIRPFALAVLLLLGLLAAAWFLRSWSPEAVAATSAQRTPALTITTATPRHANWPTTLAVVPVAFTYLDSLNRRIRKFLTTSTSRRIEV
jgi:hypothetical protein